MKKSSKKIIVCKYCMVQIPPDEAQKSKEQLAAEGKLTMAIMPMTQKQYKKYWSIK